MNLRALVAVFALMIGALCIPVRGQTIGSPLIPRDFDDIDLGQVYIYAGTTSPFQPAGVLSSWSFFDDNNAGRYVTPVLFEITGAQEFTVAGIGATRTSSGLGLQSFPFDLIAGSSSLADGDFTFGFTNRRYLTNSNGLIGGATNAGLVDFERAVGPVAVDRWYVTAGATSGGVVTLQIGGIVGAAGWPIYNPFDPGGYERVYSAQATSVPEPGSITILAMGIMGLVAAHFIKRPRVGSRALPQLS